MRTRASAACRSNFGWRGEAPPNWWDGGACPLRPRSAPSASLCLTASMQPGNKNCPDGLFIPFGDRPLADNMESIMSAKILAGAALALAAVLVAGERASAQNWGCHHGCYPDYVYAPMYAGPYGAFGGDPWRYHGGPHPSTGHL